MALVNSEIIAEVRQRTNLYEIISEHVVLKRAGKDYKGLCPFHKEKTPSFHVSVEKGIYKCFGCGEGGDAFSFLQKVRGQDFLEVIRELAHKYGIKLVESESDQKEYDRRSLLALLCQQASEYFIKLFQHSDYGQKARDYLQARGISADIIEEFKLGYAGDSWDGLLNHLVQANKVSPATVEEAGLARKRNDGSGYFDLFRNRLMVPICDESGKVIAFGGRTLGDDEVKYLNSPETPIYTKGNHLFGFNLAKEHIRAKDSVIVVEGYFDAITAHQYGFKNTVATLGTALTDRQAKLLMRFTDSKRVYLSFDQDVAGQKATFRGLETIGGLAEGIGFDLRVVCIPSGKDPDECLRTMGADVFQKAINSAPGFMDYRLEKSVEDLDLQSHNGRIDAGKRVVPIIASIKNAVARGEYMRQWSQRLGVREEDLYADISQFLRQNRSVNSPTVARQNNSTRVVKKPAYGQAEAERQLLAFVLTSRDDYSMAMPIIEGEYFSDKQRLSIRDALLGIGTSFGSCEDLEYQLRNRLAQDAEASRELVEIIWKVEEMREQNLQARVVLSEVRCKLLRERLYREQESVRRQLNESSDDEQFNFLMSKISQLKHLEDRIKKLADDDSELDNVKKEVDRLTVIA